eukprot:6175526-Prymnesium_polylepis.1
MVPDPIGGSTGMPTVPAIVPDSSGGDESSDRSGERTKRNCDQGTSILNWPNFRTIPLYFWDPKGKSSWRTQQSKDGAERRE